MAAVGEKTPAGFRKTLSGLGSLPANLAARDTQIGMLLASLRKVAGTLAERRTDVVSLMYDSRELLDALVGRRRAIHDLLVSTSRLSEQITLLVRQSRSDLAPALSNLESVVAILRKNQTGIDTSLRLMAPFYRVFTSTLGSGPWFDGWISNLPPGPARDKN